MPNTFFPAAEQGQSTKEGAFLVGDSWNMRHPLTGGGMTVAFNDVVILRDLLENVEDFTDWSDMSHVLHKWHWRRKQYASTINILSVALYDLFGADGECVTSGFIRKADTGTDECLEVLRTGCFKYFERGGNCVLGPVSLLAGYVLWHKLGESDS